MHPRYLVSVFIWEQARLESQTGAGDEILWGQSGFPLVRRRTACVSVRLQLVEIAASWRGAGGWSDASTSFHEGLRLAGVRLALWTDPRWQVNWVFHESGAERLAFPSSCRWLKLLRVVRA